MDETGFDARAEQIGGNLVVLHDNKNMPILATPPDSEHRGSTLTKLHLLRERLDALQKEKKKMVVVFPYNETRDNPDGTATIDKGYKAILVEPQKAFLKKEIKAKVTLLEGKKLDRVMKGLSEGSDKLVLAPIMESPQNGNLMVDDAVSTEEAKEMASGTTEQFLAQAGEATIHRIPIVTPEEAFQRTQEGIMKNAGPDVVVEKPYSPNKKKEPYMRDSTQMYTSILKDEKRAPETERTSGGLADKLFSEAQKTKQKQPQEV